MHDGLGPQLASLTLKLDAARNLLKQDAQKVEPLLVELREQAQAAVMDIPGTGVRSAGGTSDQLGLVSALREYAAAQTKWPVYHRYCPQPVQDLAMALPSRPLSYCFRNLHQRGASSRGHPLSEVHLTLNNSLNLEVRDDGQEFSQDHKTGVGLASMQERAAELGGIFVMDSQPGKGTVIRVQLPLKTKVETV
ncbi:MAG: hypothetical protein IPL78_35765 [Chloroflexi bacterium]|nr:hypothetical protein [Chloroflexota bacterium]